MSDVPRFDCFDDGMREGYNERWVRSSDYDALRAERDALAKDAARYRWLSGRSAQSESPRWARWEIRRWTGRVWDTLDADGCDLEVDAAMLVEAREAE